MQKATTFHEYLFSNVPQRVAEKEILEEDPVALLCRRHAHDVNWPVNAHTQDQVLRYLFNYAFRMCLSSPDLVVRLSMEPQKHDTLRALLTDGVTRYMLEVASLRYTLGLAWADFEKQRDDLPRKIAATH